MRYSFFRTLAASLLIGLMSISLSGCGRGDGVDGKVYHIQGGGPYTIEFKGGKAKVEMMGQTQTLDYKVDSDTVTIINKTEGDMVLNRHPDGSLTCVLGTFTPAQ